MQQHERLALAAFDVVQTNTADFDEPTGRRIVAFSLLGAFAIVERGGRERADCCYRRNGEGL